MELDSFLITTTNSIPGIELYFIGIVSAVVDGYDMEQLLKSIEEKTKSEGGFAVIGFKTTSIEENGKPKLLGYGTAVKQIEGQWAVY